VETYLVRHACAGRKGSWSGPDDARPLDPAGERQALALADVLAGEPVRRLLSSPTRRCVQTLEPLAGRLGLPIEEVGWLGADADASAALAALGDGELGCTHGELLRPLLQRFRAEGVTVEAARDDDGWLLLKGTAWALTVDDGRVTRLRHLAPDPRSECPDHGAGRGTAWSS
jgi:hypothetical protein